MSKDWYAGSALRPDDAPLALMMMPRGLPASPRSGRELGGRATERRRDSARRGVALVDLAGPEGLREERLEVGVGAEGRIRDVHPATWQATPGRARRAKSASTTVFVDGTMTPSFAR